MKPNYNPKMSFIYLLVRGIYPVFLVMAAFDYLEWKKCVKPGPPDPKYRVVFGVEVPARHLDPVDMAPGYLRSAIGFTVAFFVVGLVCEMGLYIYRKRAGDGPLVTPLIGTVNPGSAAGVSNDNETDSGNDSEKETNA